MNTEMTTFWSFDLRREMTVSEFVAEEIKGYKIGRVTKVYAPGDRPIGCSLGEQLWRIREDWTRVLTGEEIARFAPELNRQILALL